MKPVSAKISSVAMALLLLFSTMSFSVGMHFCGDHLVDFSLFDGADTCGMKSEASAPSGPCAMMETDADCCSDLEVFVEGQEDLKVSFDQLSFGQQVFVSSFIASYTGLFEGYPERISSFRDYIPPPLIRDIQVLDQTFLI